LIDKLIYKLKVFLVTIGLVFVFVSCGKEEKKPDYLWPKEKFVEVMTEIQITETVIRLGIHRAQDSIILKDSLFAALFREMEVNRAVYDSNYNYYLKRPAEMEAIFDEVMVNLSERSALLKEKKESETE
tara:strand:+ start:366 stop:752 length:387 start_codon:yes stop_codon:yes gene_type:complete